VQEVVSRLLISRVEHRTDRSPDVARYIQRTNVDEVLVRLPPPLLRVRATLLQLVRPTLQRLVEWRVGLYRKSLNYLTPAMLLQVKQQLQRVAHHLSRSQQLTAASMLSTMAGLHHAFSILHRHGLHSLVAFLENYRADALASQSKVRKNEVNKREYGRALKLAKDALACHSLPPLQCAPVLVPDSPSHPKFGLLTALVRDHFAAAQQHRPYAPVADLLRNTGVRARFRPHTIDDDPLAAAATLHQVPPSAPPADTRIMVFAQNRVCVEEIHTLLSELPGVRSAFFVGQSSSGSSTARGGHKKNSNAGMKQKEQALTLRRFRAGEVNLLVATCIGEEGLDIGEVDLIVCFDASASSSSIVQRKGRTGRKRDGRCVILLTEVCVDGLSSSSSPPLALCFLSCVVRISSHALSLRSSVVRCHATFSRASPPLSAGCAYILWLRSPLVHYLSVLLFSRVSASLVSSRAHCISQARPSILWWSPVFQHSPVHPLYLRVYARLFVCAFLLNHLHCAGR
jgi:fanconi anemia group M protein